MATRVGLGKVAINAIPVAINQDLKALYPKNGSLLPRYLLFFLTSIAEKIEREGTGATVKGVTLDYLKRIRVPIPSLPEQERIVSILDAAEDLCRLRKQGDRRTADLIPALFDEMFGDPATNPERWPRVPIQDLTVGKYGIKAGPFGSALKKEFYTSSGYRVYGQEQVIAGDFSIGDYFIDQARFDSLKSCAVSPGDLLISLVGTIGRAVVVPEGVAPGIINPRLIKITPNPKLVESVFLVEFLAQTGIQESLKRSAHGGTMDVLNAGILKLIRVPLPPLSLQQHFAACVAGIRALEAKQAVARRRLDDLLQSLLHRAFQGEI